MLIAILTSRKKMKYINIKLYMIFDFHNYINRVMFYMQISKLHIEMPNIIGNLFDTVVITIINKTSVIMSKIRKAICWWDLYCIFNSIRFSNEFRRIIGRKINVPSMKWYKILLQNKQNKEMKIMAVISKYRTEFNSK